MITRIWSEAERDAWVAAGGVQLDEFDNPVRTRPPKKRRQRKLTLVSVAKQASRAGIEVARFEIDPTTGKIVIVTGKPEATANENPWDVVLSHEQH